MAIKNTNYGTYDEYLNLKRETDKQSYKDEHKKTNIGLLITSWLSNATSVYLAFFFVKSLVDNVLDDAKGSIFISIIILVFLSLFELIKRHIFGLFSKDLIRNNFKIFNKDLWLFNLSVLLIVSFSAYLSLNGAQKMMNKDKVISQHSENLISVKTDSIQNYYMLTFIKPIQDEVKTLNTQNDNYMSASQNQTKMSGKYVNLISQNNIKIKDDLTRISQYEKERDGKINEIKNTQNLKLNNQKSENKSNISIFIAISAIIESLIMLGVYFNIYYKFRVKKEYEEVILASPKLTRWKTYNDLADVVFEGVDVGDVIPTINEIRDIAMTNNLRVTTKDIENFGKMLYYIRAIEKRGNKRCLTMPVEKILETLKKYYKIN
jgi:hypothetical protein